MTDTDTWGINETLLQSYRSLFISSQSFLLAVGAMVLDKSLVVLVAVAALSAFMIWVTWFPVVRSRHLIVDYHKFGRLLSSDKRSKLCSEKEYVRDADKRRKANVLLGIDRNWRPSRVKLDFITPVLFTAVWVVLLIYRWLYA